MITSVISFTDPDLGLCPRVHGKTEKHSRDRETQGRGGVGVVERIVSFRAYLLTKLAKFFLYYRRFQLERHNLTSYLIIFIILILW